MENKKLRPLELLMKDYLDGKVARVRAGGLHVHGSLEGECNLSYKPFYGISLVTRLKYNSSKITNGIKKALYDSKDTNGFKYSQLESVSKIIEEFIEPTFVESGLVSLYGVKSYSICANKEGVITDLDILYHSGSLIEIHNIKDFKL